MEGERCDWRECMLVVEGQTLGIERHAESLSLGFCSAMIVTGALVRAVYGDQSQPIRDGYS